MSTSITDVSDVEDVSADPEEFTDTSIQSTSAADKNESKKRKFNPLVAVRKFFKSNKKRSKLKDNEDISIVSMRAKSTSALHRQSVEDYDEEDDGGFLLLRRSLRKNKSRSEDSVLMEQRAHKSGFLRKLACSVEGIDKSLHMSRSGKLSGHGSQHSLNSSDSYEGFSTTVKEWQSSSYAYVDMQENSDGIDLEAVAKTPSLNTDAAKFKISVRPKSRRGSRQNRRNISKISSTLPSLNEEQCIGGQEFGDVLQKSTSPESNTADETVTSDSIPSLLKSDNDSSVVYSPMKYEIDKDEIKAMPMLEIAPEISLPNKSSTQENYLINSNVHIKDTVDLSLKLSPVPKSPVKLLPTTQIFEKVSPTECASPETTNIGTDTVKEDNVHFSKLNSVSPELSEASNRIRKDGNVTANEENIENENVPKDQIFGLEKLKPEKEKDKLSKEQVSTIRYNFQDKENIKVPSTPENLKLAFDNEVLLTPDEISVSPGPVYITPTESEILIRFSTDSETEGEKGTDIDSSDKLPKNDIDKLVTVSESPVIQDQTAFDSSKLSKISCDSFSSSSSISSQSKMKNLIFQSLPEENLITKSLIPLYVPTQIPSAVTQSVHLPLGTPLNVPDTKLTRKMLFADTFSKPSWVLMAKKKQAFLEVDANTELIKTMAAVKSEGTREMLSGKKISNPKMRKEMFNVNMKSPNALLETATCLPTTSGTFVLPSTLPFVPHPSDKHSSACDTSTVTIASTISTSNITSTCVSIGQSTKASTKLCPHSQMPHREKKSATNVSKSLSQKTLGQRPLSAEITEPLSTSVKTFSQCKSAVPSSNTNMTRAMSVKEKSLSSRDTDNTIQKCMPRRSKSIIENQSDASLKLVPANNDCNNVSVIQNNTNRLSAIFEAKTSAQTAGVFKVAHPLPKKSIVTTTVTTSSTTITNITATDITSATLGKESLLVQSSTIQKDSSSYKIDSQGVRKEVSKRIGVNYSQPLESKTVFLKQTLNMEELGSQSAGEISPSWKSDINLKKKDIIEKPVKIEIVPKSEVCKASSVREQSSSTDTNNEKNLSLREKNKTEKCSDLTARQSKVLDMVKNFQKLQAT